MNWTAAIKGTFQCAALAAVAALALNTLHVENVQSKHAAEVQMQLGDTITKVNKTLDKINAPGGLLQATGKAVEKANNLIGHSDILVAHEQSSLDAWNRQISDTLGNVNTSVVALTSNENKVTTQTMETLSATTESVKSLKPLVGSLNEETQALKTATVSITAMVPDVAGTAKNVNGITAHGNVIIGNAEKVSTKLTNDFMKPVPWWKKPFAYAGETWDILAAVARHIP
jgi:ABC-type transporter Mla subunit MlaD